MNIVPSTKNLSRYQEIITVLARHGFGWLAAELKLRGLLPLAQRLSPTGVAESNVQATHLRLAFEELGTTFIKLGQVLSTRADLLSSEYIAELVKLQDATPPVPYEQIVAVFEAELAASPEDIFVAFDPTPIASASIGQVHAARLSGGEDVVVKIQRPGVAALVDRDLDILLDLAGSVAEHTDFGRDYDVLGLAQEFAFSLRCELNYIREGQNADRFRQAFANDPDLHIPQVYWDYTTERVIVLEKLEGIKVNDLAALETADINRQRIAANSVRLMLEEMFVHGFFHADPHPGNLYVLADGRIGMMDFGMVGRLDEMLQESLTRLFLALSKGDSERMIDELITSGIAQGQINRKTLKRDLDHMIACYANGSVEDLAAARIFNELTGLAQRHHLQLPSDLVLMTKVMAISEGLGLQLDPDFQFIPFAQPYLERYWLQRHSPWQMGEKVVEGILEMTEFSLTFPRRLTRLVTQLERGELGAHVEVRGVERYLAEMQAMANRLAMSILIGALIIGLSQFMHMVTPQGFPELYAGRFFGILFFVATVLGFWLLVNIIRARRANY
jgi:ubiquinone biosynthesis protein